MKILTRTLIVSAALVLTAASGCTLDSIDAPPLTGPSSFALDLTVTATPDILPEDGVSTTVIRIVARDHNNQPVANLPLRIDTVLGSRIVDIGRLSARNVTTNASGVATVTFTAPRSPLPGVDLGSQVTIAVTPVGTDFGSNFQRTVNIRLVPESTAMDPGAPTPNFFFTPSNPAAGEQVRFDATASSDDGVIVRFRWDYGDGDVETGPEPREQHDYDRPGTYPVTLTVTDNDGKSASLTKFVTVS
ncbi:MAG: PKD domain-containing protein [Vicinamibacterales bacterium]